METPRFSAITPVFQVAELERGIDFYTRVMGFELAATWGTPGDRASLCRDGVEITLEVEADPHPSSAYAQVAGIDAYFEAVTAAGATVVRPLGDRAYGMRDGRVADPDGNQLVLGEAIS